MTIPALFFAAAILLSGAAHAGTLEGREAFETGDFATAYKELTKAARAGDGEAHYVLGQMYASGRGVKKSAAAAVAHYGKGARAGYPAAQREYGSALILGDGVKKDIDAGLKWLMIASRLGDKDAAKLTATFTKVFPPNVVQTAKFAASKWQRENETPETGP